MNFKTVLTLSLLVSSYSLFAEKTFVKQDLTPTKKTTKSVVIPEEVTSVEFTLKIIKTDDCDSETWEEKVAYLGNYAQKVEYEIQAGGSFDVEEFAEEIKDAFYFCEENDLNGECGLHFDGPETKKSRFVEK